MEAFLTAPRHDPTLAERVDSDICFYPSADDQFRARW
jgi:hypothetical protein